MSYNFKKIRFWREEDIGVLIPSSENTFFDIETVSELLSVLLSTSQDNSVNHIIITNQGTKHFFLTPSEFCASNIQSFVKLIRSLVITIKQLDKNVIIAVNGNVDNIVTEFSFVGDFLFVRADAHFSLNKLKYGLPLIMTDSHFYLSNKMLISLFLGKRITGKSLYHAGVAQGMSDGPKFYDELKEFIKKLPEIYRVHKVLNFRNFYFSFTDPYEVEKITKMLKRYYGL